jgi:hypothetical protein
MAEQQQHAPGGYYSSTNKIPTVQKFIENLDKGKKDRDKQIDEAQKRKAQSGVEAHRPNPKGKNQREATDPVTGRDVVIEDATSAMYKHVTDPLLSVPNANLGKDSVGVESINCDFGLTVHSISKRKPRSRYPNTKRSRTSQLPQIRLNQELPRMCQFMARKQISFSIPPLQ